MPLPTNAASVRNLLIAAAVVVTTSALAVAGPAPVAHAEAGFRVCGVYNSSNAPTRGGIGTGLVIKVSRSGKDTCGRKVTEMERRYAQAYPGSRAEHNYQMLKCEDWMTRMAFPGADFCVNMAKDVIYKVSSPADLLHPVTTPVLEKLG
jgi:hypothetical protein